MYQIQENFEDFNRPNRKGSCALNADKPMSHQHFICPVTWSGYVSGHKVEIIQKRDSLISASAFEWKVFPDNYESLKSDIAEWIDNYLHRMLD